MVQLGKFFLKQSWSFLVFASPFALRLFVFTFVVSLRLSIIAVLSAFKGIHPVADAIAKDWTWRAIDAGFPYLWEVQLYNMFYVLAFCTILAGWAVLFFTAVFIVNLLV